MKNSIYADEQLIQFIRSNDPKQRNEALKQLYMDQVITLKVKELAQIYGSAKQEADDILQEGIILMDELVRSGKFQGQSKVRTFLIGICKNLIRNQSRKVSRIVLKEEIKDYERNEAEVSPEDLIVLEESTDEQLSRDKLLRNLLHNLTENCQEVLRLYYYEAKNMTQVADERGLKNAKQAKKAASRCRQQLRKLITEQPELETFLKQHFH